MNRFALVSLLVLAGFARGQTTTAWGHDALTVPGKSISVSARFQRDDQPLVDRSVTFSVLGQSLSARTDEAGIARASVKPGQAGVYKVTARLDSSSSSARATGYLHVVDRPLVLVDIDETISAVKFQAVKEGGGDDAPTYPGAPELLNDLAKTHAIVYLTGRDDRWERTTRTFLKNRGFPAGALQMNLRREWDDGAYKLRVMQGMRARGLKLDLGLGNKPSDAKAYLGAGARAYILRNNAFDASLDAFWYETYAELRARLVQEGALPATGIVDALPN